MSDTKVSVRPYIIGPASTSFVVPAGGGGGDDASTTAWVTAVGTVSSTQRGYVNTLIVALKAHSLWTKMDRIWLFAGESSASQATIDLVNLQSNSPVSSPTLGASGYAFSGANYVNTNFAAGGGAVYVRDSAHYSYYIMNSRTTEQNYPQGAGNGAFNQLAGFNPYFTGASYLAAINEASFALGVSNPNAQGLYVISRTGSTAGSARKNSGAVSGSITSTSTPIPGANFFIGGISAGASPTAFSQDTVGLFTAGSGLTTGESDQLATDLNAYMISWGVNTYT